MKIKSKWFVGQCETSRCVGKSVSWDEWLEMFQCSSCRSGAVWTRDMLHFLEIPGSITCQLIREQSSERL